MLKVKKIFTYVFLIIPSAVFIFGASKLAYSAATVQENALLVIPAYWMLWVALIPLSFLFHHARNGFSKINDLERHTRVYKKILLFVFLSTQIVWALYFSSGEGITAFAEGLLKHPMLFMGGLLISAVIFCIMLINLADLSYLLKKAGIVKDYPSFYLICHVLLCVFAIWIASLVIPFSLYFKATKKLSEAKSKRCSRCGEFNNPKFEHCWKCGHSL